MQNPWVVILVVFSFAGFVGTLWTCPSKYLKSIAKWLVITATAALGLILAVVFWRVVVGAACVGFLLWAVQEAVASGVRKGLGSR